MVSLSLLHPAVLIGARGRQQHQFKFSDLARLLSQNIDGSDYRERRTPIRRSPWVAYE